MELRMKGTKAEIEDYLDMITDQGMFYTKITEQMTLKEYIENNLKKSNRTDPYNLKELENKDISVVFIKVFLTKEELLDDAKREKKYKEKLAAKESFKTVRTSTGITYGGKRQKGA